MQEVDVAIIGGGQAGICLSYYLKERGITHLVYEKDQPFSSWQNRWEGFRANTPNWMNRLPIAEAKSSLPDGANGFASKQQMLRYFDACADAVDAPVLTGTEVTRARPSPDGTWTVVAAGRNYQVRAVAVCNGAMSVPRIPEAAVNLSDEVPTMHSSEYRSPEQIPTGSVLIVGTASSGVQVARLLGEDGRFDQIHLAQSSVLVLPRHILGLPIHRAIHLMGLFDVKTDSFLGRRMYSGLETRGDPIMYPRPRDLARAYGVNLHGRLADIDEDKVLFDDGSELSADDLTIIWCTGFKPDYEFLDLPGSDKAFLPNGQPRHRFGVSTDVAGLYFVGLRYQRTVASHDIYGVGADARLIAGEISEYLKPHNKRELERAG